ncbi:hypothetical protein BDV93DRAFT_517879 [Ceratobasidium sp. AG-I]|nr:hypothetical protein BDV93DRAFT_517879 [Ceratobasidium sp. AG-I]
MADTLRDFVASELGKLPGSRTLTLHALVSTPQREIELFPYAQTPRNLKISSQNILLLISEAVKSDSTDGGDAAGAPNILVAALEATLYLFPGTSSSILYIGKVDTTGFSNVSPSPARTLARATIDYYVRPDTRPAECGQRVWVHLFARAQSQYLFPDSADWKAKRVLGDAGLVRWWWSLFGDVARDVAGAQKDQQAGFKGTKLWYILPGFSDLEAYHTLSSGSSFKLAQSGELPWTYGHPYDDPAISFPLTGKPLESIPKADNSPSLTETSAKVMSIASLIPTFPDDPKARFLGEIASTTSETDLPTPAPKTSSPISKLRRMSSPKSSSSPPPASPSSSPSHSPAKKRRRVEEGTHPGTSLDNALAEKSDHADGSPKSAALVPTGSTSTGLETIITPQSEPGAAQIAPSTPPRSSTAVPAKGAAHTETELVRRGRQALAAVSAREFWERMGFRQECALGAVTAFFVAVFESNDPTSKVSDSKIFKECIPLPTHTRILQSLMNHAFSTPEKAIRSTQMLESSIRTLCDGASSTSGEQGSGDSREISSFYHSHIYKKITINNPPLLPREAIPVQPVAVNVLQVKRKVRR